MHLNPFQKAKLHVGMHDSCKICIVFVRCMTECTQLILCLQAILHIDGPLKQAENKKCQQHSPPTFTLYGQRGPHPLIEDPPRKNPGYTPVVSVHSFSTNLLQHKKLILYYRRFVIVTLPSLETAYDLWERIQLHHIKYCRQLETCM